VTATVCRGSAPRALTASLPAVGMQSYAPEGEP
jgi:hypothetical protein